METWKSKRSPGTTGAGNIAARPRGVSRDYDVCKLIDTTTCIGCKACEVACVEWNGYEFRETTFDNTYQTMPETAWNFWNLIKFNEVETDGGLQWLMRKDQCMHCEEPGCLIACPADGAIVQYTNGIVDFNQANCIGCQYCVTGCPFNIPKFNEATKKVYKCTLCSDRVGAGLEPACIKSCPTGCLHFGSKEDMKFEAEKRVNQLHANGHADAGVYDPSGVAGHARNLRAGRCQTSRELRRFARRSQGPSLCEVVEGPAQVAWRHWHGGRRVRRLHALCPFRSQRS